VGTLKASLSTNIPENNNTLFSIVNSILQAPIIWPAFTKNSADSGSRNGRLTSEA
jgi:hypothetical protein